MSEDGRVWPLLTEEAKVMPCGWEKRRRKMMERWEAPPLGPPRRWRRKLSEKMRWIGGWHARGGKGSDVDRKE